MKRECLKPLYHGLQFATAAKRSQKIVYILGCVCLGQKKKIVVFQVPCQKKTGSVGRLYFFFFFFFFLDSHRSSVMLVP